MSMTENEAKEILEGIYIDSTNESYPFTEKFGEAVNVAIKALEKQIPKKAIITGHNNAINTDVGYCPICKGVILRVCDNIYCPECGQKLDWSDEE